MQTAREYCIGLGLAKAGRGRLSLEAKAALNDALSKGITFSDYPKTTISLPARGDAPAKTIAAVAKPNDFVNAAEPLYPKNLRVFVLDGLTRKEISNRECCFDCGYSFRWCACDPGRYVIGYDYPRSVSKEY